MAEEKRIKPFLATYYNPRRFGSLSDLVCPPYDVISKEELKRLNRRSAHNFSHILLRKGSASYGKLKETFSLWLQQEVLVEDAAPAFYVTLQEFRVGGKRFKRRGFLGLLKLEGDQVVFPHEKTHAKPKKDRLEVIRQVRANLSPIFIIYPRKGKEPLARIVKKLSKTPAFFKVTDSKRVAYKVWRLTDTRELQKIGAYFKKAPLLIADGHHRFEVARSFFKRNKRRRSQFKDLHYILAYLSPQDENLLILPTHRVLIKRLDKERLFKKLAPYFAVKREKSLKSLEKYLSHQSRFSFGFFQGRDLYSFSLKEAGFLDRIYAKDNAYKRLDAFLLHEWVFKKILKLKVDEDMIRYCKSLRQAVSQAKRHKGCSFVMRAPKLTDVMAVAFKGLTLPQKTTYFYPKFLSGVILRQL